jgi:hypothetical protein
VNGDTKRPGSARRQRYARRQERALSAIFTVIAAACGILAIVFSVAEINARADSDAYNSSPVCPRPGIVYSKCRVVEPGVIDGQAYVKGSKSKVTVVPLRVSGRPTDYTATLEGQVSGSFPNGSPVTITVWGPSVAEISDSTASWMTEENPQWSAGNDVGGVVGMLGMGAILARVASWALWHGRLAWRRFMLADIAVLPLIVTVGVLLGIHSVTVGAYLCWITVAFIALTITVWPRLAWVRRPANSAFSQSEQPKGAVTL